MAILSNNQHIGNYEVKRLIKENLYCETYRVEDANEEPFFLKIFVLKNTPTKMIDNDGWLRFINISKRLSHKNIISFVECGIYETEATGICQYAITNYCNGELLADKLQRKGKLPLEEAERIFQNILDGLKYMHSQDILHNDITPRNIMLSERTGEAEIIDMSHVSTYVSGAPPFDTADLDVSYQSVAAHVGLYNRSTDIFSAVGVFYTMLTGRVPWDITYPDDADRKKRILIAKEARNVPLPVKDVEAPVNIIKVLKLGNVVHGNCMYKSVDELRNDMENKGDSPLTNESEPKSTPTQATSSSENALELDVQKGGGNGFKDIAGMDQLKQMLTQKVIFILKDKEKGCIDLDGEIVNLFRVIREQLEELVLDRATMEIKKNLANKFAQIVYEGKWFTPLREAIQAFMEVTQQTVTGEVKFRLYKGNIIKAGETSPFSLYSESLASFTTGDLYDHHDADGFITLFGLPLKVRAMMMQKVAQEAKAAKKAGVADAVKAVKTTVSKVKKADVKKAAGKAPAKKAPAKKAPAKKAPAKKK